MTARRTCTSSRRTIRSSRAYQRLFPDLFRPPRRCPPICARTPAIPETLFRVQAEIYRTYHMLDPQSFYNKEDLWDLARHTTGAGRRQPNR